MGKVGIVLWKLVEERVTANFDALTVGVELEPEFIGAGDAFSVVEDEGELFLEGEGLALQAGFPEVVADLAVGLAFDFKAVEDLGTDFFEVVPPRTLLDAEAL